MIVQPKTASGRRTLVMPEQLVSSLREHLARQDGERKSAGNLWQDTGLVFTTPTGTPIDPSNDHRNWQLLLDAAGVRRARLHDARHTAATLLLIQGVPARVVMQILGHSSDLIDPRHV